MYQFGDSKSMTSFLFANLINTFQIIHNFRVFYSQKLQKMILFILAALSVTCHASSYTDLLADLQYLYNIDRLEKSMPLPEYYPDDSYDKLQDDWDVAYPDSASYSEPGPKEVRDYGVAALRDQEYMKQLPISGYQYITGMNKLF